MQYKTIVIELLQQRPQFYRELQKTRQLMPTVNSFSAWLKTRHQFWMDQLSTQGMSESQTGTEAMELAMSELLDSLPLASLPSADEAFSLDAAMALLHRPPT